MYVAIYPHQHLMQNALRTELQAFRFSFSSLAYAVIWQGIRFQGYVHPGHGLSLDIGPSQSFSTFLSSDKISRIWTRVPRTEH